MTLRFAGEPHQSRFSRTMRFASLTTSYSFTQDNPTERGMDPGFCRDDEYEISRQGFHDPLFLNNHGCLPEGVRVHSAWGQYPDEAGDSIYRMSWDLQRSPVDYSCTGTAAGASNPSDIPLATSSAVSRDCRRVRAQWCGAHFHLETRSS